MRVWLELECIVMYNFRINSSPTNIVSYAGTLGSEAVFTRGFSAEINALYAIVIGGYGGNVISGCNVISKASASKSVNDDPNGTIIYIVKATNTTVYYQTYWSSSVVLKLS